MSKPIPFISNEDILKNISMPDAIHAMEKAFQIITSNSAIIPLRINMHMEEMNADSLVMPVYSPELKRYAVKTVSLNYDNRKIDLPLVHTLLTLFDAENGIPMAMMDAEIITAMRTGAGGGLAVRKLSKEDSSHLVAFGAGIQSEYQIRAILAVRDIQKISLISRTRAKAESLKLKLSEDFNISIEITDNLKEMEKADIITTATTSTEPIFRNMNLKPHIHFNAVGSYKPTLIEIDPKVISECHLIVDQKSACMKEAGDIRYAIDNGFMIDENNVKELGEITDGSDLKPEMTVFKSVGNAIQDLVLASTIYDMII